MGHLYNAYVKMRYQLQKSPSSPTDLWFPKPLLICPVNPNVAEYLKMFQTSHLIQSLKVIYLAVVQVFPIAHLPPDFQSCCISSHFAGGQKRRKAQQQFEGKTIVNGPLEQCTF